MALPLTDALHLYRALLRECTYLPDSQARTYFRDHVISSYRTYLPRNHRHRKEIPIRRQVALLHRGRKGLSVLRRANEGYLKPLQHVLSLTYGRKGRRQRELMAELMQEDIPSDHEAVHAPSVPQKYSRDWLPPSAVMALIRSQSMNTEHLERTVTGSTKLTPKPDIPELNTWGRQMPEKRVKNMMREWYAKQLGRLLPPLPEREIQRLQELSSGKIGTDDGPVPRRRKVVAPSAETPSTLNEKLLLGGPPKGHTFEAYVDGRPHKLKPRLLQRMWLSILHSVPVMTRDPSKDKWEVKWTVKGRARPHVSEPASDHLVALFGNP